MNGGSGEKRDGAVRLRPKICGCEGFPVQIFPASTSTSRRNKPIRIPH